MPATPKTLNIPASVTQHYMQQLIEKLKKTQHGFKHIVAAGDNLLADKTICHFDIAKTLLIDASYQARMLATYLLGELWKASNHNALVLLKTKIAHDDNWRVHEMLAKSIDSYCRATGYENSLPTIKEWLNEKNPNLKRAVIEGLRIWTSRPYFKDHPNTAIKLIGNHNSDDSEYVRRSVGNALLDIRKKHLFLIQNEIATWDVSNPTIAFTYKIVIRKQPDEQTY